MASCGSAYNRAKSALRSPPPPAPSIAPNRAPTGASRHESQTRPGYIWRGSATSPAYGARPLKRTIQKEVETVLGRMLLQGKVRDGQTVLVDYGGDKGLTFLPQTAHEAAAV